MIDENTSNLHQLVSRPGSTGEILRSRLCKDALPVIRSIRYNIQNLRQGEINPHAQNSLVKFLPYIGEKTGTEPQLFACSLSLRSYFQNNVFTDIKYLVVYI